VWMLIQRTRRLESRHQEAKELALLGTLAANLAHEIRNPLNSINLNLELLEEDLEDAGVGEARHSLVGTRTEVSRLGKLVNDFLTYARPTDPVVDQVALDELVRECREFLAAEAAAAGVHLKVVSDSERVVCAGDPAQLKQVVLNLTLNAIQAVADHPPDRRVVALETRITGGDGVLTVRDRGDGIPVEHLTRVTEAFFTMKRGGTGLGLAIAKRFIAAQGGRLELENLETGGFESRIVLPRLEEGGKMAS
jgi:signal transduction histidine kinase